MARAKPPPPNEQIEVELRIELEPLEFHAVFAECASWKKTFESLGTTRQCDAIYDNRSMRGEPFGTRRRICCTPDTRQPLFTMWKRPMLRDKQTLEVRDDLVLRIDAQRETYEDATPVLNNEQIRCWRAKDRRSFRLVGCTWWQIDMTRIVQYRRTEQDADADVRYELELELAQSALLDSALAPVDIVAQLECVIRALFT